MSGVTPEECFYVGDSDVDVFTANNAGVKWQVFHGDSGEKTSL